MASLIGPAIGVATSLFGGSSAKATDQQAAQQDLTGFNYLNGGAGAPTITGAESNGAAAGTAQAGTQSAEAQLLGTQPMQPGTASAFSNYLNSTGYKFQQQQGSSAITGSAAARGILNSGSTAKALTSYGSNLASTTFNNYLSGLSGLNTQQGATAGQGITAAQAVGQAGTSGGAGASTATQNGGNASANGIATAGGMAAAAAGNFFAPSKAPDLSPVGVTPNVFGGF